MPLGKGINAIYPAFLGRKDTVEQCNSIQKYLAEDTRLGIPVIFVDEGQHDMMHYNSTVFLQIIGMACF